MAWEVDEWGDPLGTEWTVRFRDGDRYTIRLPVRMGGSADEKRAAAERICESLNLADDREALIEKLCQALRALARIVDERK